MAETAWSENTHTHGGGATVRRGRKDSSSWRSKKRALCEDRLWPTPVAKLHRVFIKFGTRFWHYLFRAFCTLIEFNCSFLTPTKAPSYIYILLHVSASRHPYGAHKKFSSKREFRENRLSDNHTLLSTVNEFPFPWSIWVKVDQHVMPPDIVWRSESKDRLDTVCVLRHEVSTPLSVLSSQSRASTYVTVWYRPWRGVAALATVRTYRTQHVCCIHDRNAADRTYLIYCPVRAWTPLRCLGVREGRWLCSVTFTDFHW